MKLVSRSNKYCFFIIGLIITIICNLLSKILFNPNSPRDLRLFYLLIKLLDEEELEESIEVYKGVNPE